MNATHIEVKDAGTATDVKTGQLLTVTKETPAFFFVRKFHGTEIKISKKTGKACGWNAQFDITFNV